MKKRTSINITVETAKFRQQIVSRLFDHKVSADVSEKRLVEMAKKQLESETRVKT